MCFRPRIPDNQSYDAGELVLRPASAGKKQLRKRRKKQKGRKFRIQDYFPFQLHDLPNHQFNMVFRLSRIQRLYLVISVSLVFFLAEISGTVAAFILSSFTSELIFRVTVGFYTKSLALVADAFHYVWFRIRRFHVYTNNVSSTIWSVLSWPWWLFK